MLDLLARHPGSERTRKINFRPGPASYVYITCMRQISVVVRELGLSRRTASEKELSARPS